MAAPAKKKAKKQAANATNSPPTLTSLPEPVYSRILSFLPIRDAVRTSVLSKAWRLRWRRMTVVNIDERSLPKPYQANTLPSDYYSQLASKSVMKTFRRASGKNKGQWLQNPAELPDALRSWLTQRSPVLDQLVAVDILQRVMRNHKGVFDVFRLSLPIKDVQPEVLRHWMLKLFQSTVREIVLERCALDVPPGLFQGRFGFEKLGALTLKDVVITAGDLGQLISSCPSLSRLTLEIEDVKSDREAPVASLVIPAQSLTHLEMRLVGFISNIIFMTPQLVCARIDLEMFYGISIERHLNDGRCNLVDVLEGCPKLEKLTMTSLSLQFLCSGDIPSTLRRPLDRLEKLELDIDLEVPYHAHGALCMFRSSPTLKHLVIHCWSIQLDLPNLNRQSAPSIWDFASPVCTFPRLVQLVMYRFNGMDSQMAFLRFVLHTAPVLSLLDFVKPWISDVWCRLMELEELMELMRDNRITVKVHSGTVPSRNELAIASAEVCRRVNQILAEEVC